ncbi:MAG: cytochrome P450 [Cyanobacteria bacterium J06638_38]
MPTIDDMSQLPHTKMVLKKSMPLYPSAGILGRELINNCNLDDLNFTKGTVIYFSQWV